MNPNPRASTASSGPFWLPGNPLLRRLTLALMDGLILAAGLAVNFEIWLRYRHGRIPDEYLSLYFYVVLPVVVLRLGLFYVFGLYQSISRHAGHYELMLIGSASTLATAIIIVLNFCTTLIPSFGGYPLDLGGDHLLRIPWGIVFNDWMLALIAICGVRVLRREIALKISSPPPEQTRRVLIVGAGDEGEQVARGLQMATSVRFRPVAYVDPDPAMAGHKIHGIPVAGGLNDLPNAIAKYQPDEIVIALQRPTPRVLSEIVEHCRTARLGFKIVPALTSVMSGGIEISTLRPVEIEDLLGREPVRLDGGTGPDYLKGKRVLITGAGGSIGRELCRQILPRRPESIVLLGKGENSLFEALLELEPLANGARLHAVVGDVRDDVFIKKLFAEAMPQIVFHAAAHKHVHFMEAEPSEAVKNNVIGTLNVVNAARDAGVERCIFISTDKAVRPTGIMGATKRVAEMIVSSMTPSAGGVFLSVRFGNVLGSRGSVIPTFQRQIERGGPVTVTHPEVTRFFMTTAEAVSLVIQAGNIGRGGELFVLDMGKPVNIADLARNLITLSGLEPERDIPIVFTGLRPGEKLTEEILTQDEGVAATENGKIFITRNEARPWSELEPILNRLISAARGQKDDEARRILHELIPDFAAQRGERAWGNV